MPQHIQYIDKICREKQRDVLYLTFNKDSFSTTDWSSWHSRQDIIDWLNKNHMNHTPCGDVANEYGFSSYKGQIYIDVPFDESDPDFIKLSRFLEHPDGSCKFEGVTFCYLPLEHAMKNQHHDEPSYWEALMEDF